MRVHKQARNDVFDINKERFSADTVSRIGKIIKSSLSRKLSIIILYKGVESMRYIVLVFLTIAPYFDYVTLGYRLVLRKNGYVSWKKYFYTFCCLPGSGLSDFLLCKFLLWAISQKHITDISLTGSIPRRPFFYTSSHLSEIKSCKSIISTNISEIFIFK